MRSEAAERSNRNTGNIIFIHSSECFNAVETQLQIAEEAGGMVMVRFPDNHQGMIPTKYLQEV